MNKKIISRYFSQVSLKSKCWYHDTITIMTDTIKNINNLSNSKSKNIIHLILLKWLTSCICCKGYVNMCRTVSLCLKLRVCFFIVLLDLPLPPSLPPPHLRICKAFSTSPASRALRARSAQSSCSLFCSCLASRCSPASVESVFVLPSGSLATAALPFKRLLESLSGCCFPERRHACAFSYAVMSCWLNLCLTTGSSYSSGVKKMSKSS